MLNDTTCREARILNGPWNPTLSSASPNDKLAVPNRLIQRLNDTRCLNDLQRTRRSPLSIRVAELAGLH